MLSDYYILLAFPFIVIFLWFSWQNTNVIFYLLLFSLPLSFEYSFSPSLGTDVPDEFLMLLVSILITGYICYSKKPFSKYILSHPLFILLITSLTWTIITVLLSTDQFVSLKYLLAKSWYIGAFVLAPLVVLQSKRSIAVASVMITGSMMLSVIFIFIKHSSYYFSFADINNAVSPFFRNHVNYSAMLVCTIPVMFALYYLTINKKIKFLLLGFIGIATVALFFSYSRGAWLALFAGLISYWLIKNKLLFISFIAFLFVTIAALFYFKINDRYLMYTHDYNTTIYHKDFKKHFVATYKLKDVSTVERFYRWIAGVRMIKDNPVTGYGPTTFYNNYKEYAVPAYKTWVSDNKEKSTVHNYFLLTAIEQGIPGLLFFLFLLATSFYYAQYLYHRAQDLFFKTVSAAIAMILTMIVVVNFLSDLIETDKIGSLFYLCISLLIITDLNTSPVKSLIENNKELNSSPDI